MIKTLGAKIYAAIAHRRICITIILIPRYFAIRFYIPEEDKWVTLTISTASTKRVR